MGPARDDYPPYGAVCAALAGVALAAAAALGYAIGAAHDDVFEAVGTAHSAEQAISIQTDDWTYGVPLDVPWIDAQGSRHESGRPACLPPSEGPLEGIRFAAVPVEVRGGGFRQVVTVFCGGR